MGVTLVPPTPVRLARELPFTGDPVKNADLLTGRIRDLQVISDIDFHRRPGPLSAPIQRVRLEDLEEAGDVTIIDARSVKTTKDPGGPAVLSARQLFEDEPPTRWAVEPVDPAERIHPGDIAVVIEGEIGTNRTLTNDHGGAVPSRGLVLVRLPAAGGRLHRGWIRLWLDSSDFVRQVRRHATGSTLIRLMPRDLRSFDVPLPPLVEQVDATRHLDALRHDLSYARQMSAALEQLLEIETWIAAEPFDESISGDAVDA